MPTGRKAAGIALGSLGAGLEGLFKQKEKERESGRSLMDKLIAASLEARIRQSDPKYQTTLELLRKRLGEPSGLPGFITTEEGDVIPQVFEIGEPIPFSQGQTVKIKGSEFTKPKPGLLGRLFGKGKTEALPFKKEEESDSGLPPKLPGETKAQYIKRTGIKVR